MWFAREVADVTGIWQSLCQCNICENHFVTACRYVVQDTLSDRNKSMARCNGRLGEALNLLPRTDTQSLGTSILAALSVGQPLPAALRPPTRYAHDGEQQDLRQQQVCPKRAHCVRFCSACVFTLKAGSVFVQSTNVVKIITSVVTESLPRAGGW